MYLFYSVVFSLAFLAMIPRFLFRREKYAAGFSQRLGNYPEFKHDHRKVIWLHCVSVGETNAARPLVDKLREQFPDLRLVISTTTRTGQELARKIFADNADAVIYFPFDWKFSVRKAIANYKPSLVLLMETEIWPRFIHEAKHSGSKIAIVNGRLSEKSFRLYSKVGVFISRVLADVDLALMQGEYDLQRIRELGMPSERIQVTGNLKFDLDLDVTETELTHKFSERFGISDERVLIVAASTHEPEERWLLDAYCSLAKEESEKRPRFLLAPRHPERFDAVARLVREFKKDPACEWYDYTVSLRSESQTDLDRSADVIVLDSIGELRAVYPLAEIVFVGGSLIPHGGQSVLEPAAAGKAIITGPYTHNFEAVVAELLANKALIQLPSVREASLGDELFDSLDELLRDADSRRHMGGTAARVINRNRGATIKTVDQLKNIGVDKPLPY